MYISDDSGGPEWEYKADRAGCLGTNIVTAARLSVVCSLKACGRWPTSEHVIGRSSSALGLEVCDPVPICPEYPRRYTARWGQLLLAFSGRCYNERYSHDRAIHGIYDESIPTRNTADSTSMVSEN